MRDLNDRFVQAARAVNGERTAYPDAKERGLALRVSPSGVKTWSLRYRRKVDSKLVRITIGGYPAFSLSEARDEARKLKAEVARRKDPAKERKRGDRRIPRTFSELVALYMEKHAAKKRSGFKDDQMLKKDVLPALDGDPLGEIKRVDITMVLNRIVRRGAEIQANRVFEVIRKVFNFAVEEGYLEISPVHKMKAPSKPRSRDRKLSRDEIRIFWRRLVDKANMSWQTRMVLRLCLVTGQRVDEVCGARKSELDLDRAEWFLPGDRVKNNNPHLVPLSPLAVRLFRKAEARAGRGDLIFPNNTTGNHLTAHAVAVAMRRSRPVFDFKSEATPHDLRRTLASGLAELGFPRIIHDKVLNHVHGDRSTISGVYDRYEYLKEKRQALESWASHLSRIAFGEGRQGESNVVPLRQSSGA